MSKIDDNHNSLYTNKRALVNSKEKNYKNWARVKTPDWKPTIDKKPLIGFYN